MKRQEIIKLGEELKHLFETEVIKVMPDYTRGPRYAELIDMLAELRSEKELHNHISFGSEVGMDKDELSDNRGIMCKVSDFAQEFMDAKLREEIGVSADTKVNTRCFFFKVIGGLCLSCTEQVSPRGMVVARTEEEAEIKIREFLNKIACDVCKDAVVAFEITRVKP